VIYTSVLHFWAGRCPASHWGPCRNIVSHLCEKTIREKCPSGFVSQSAVGLYDNSLCSSRKTYSRTRSCRFEEERKGRFCEPVCRKIMPPPNVLWVTSERPDSVHSDFGALRTYLLTYLLNAFVLFVCPCVLIPETLLSRCLEKY